MDRPGKQQQGRAAGVGQGSFRRLDQLRIGVDNIAGTAGHDRRFRADVAGSKQSGNGFVQARLLDLEGECRQRSAAQAPGHRRHQARIDAAAQIGDHRHVGAEAMLDGPQQAGFQLVNQLLWIGAGIFLALVGKVHFPIRALRNPRGAPASRS